MFKAIATVFSKTEATEKQKSVEQTLGLSARCLPILTWPTPTGAQYGAPIVVIPRSRSAVGSRTQSPLHLLMNVTHSHVHVEVREALKASVVFRQDVAHVFSHSSTEEVHAWAVAHVSHGYFEPMALLCQWALEAGLVGLTPQYDYDKLEDVYSV